MFAPFFFELLNHMDFPPMTDRRFSRSDRPPAAPTGGTLFDPIASAARRWDCYVARKAARRQRRAKASAEG